MEGWHAPAAWLVGQICRGFNCLPSQAIEELKNDGEKLCLKILGLRNYADAKEAIDAYKPADKHTVEPEGPSVDLVYRVVAEIIKRRRAEEENKEEEQAEWERRLLE